MTAPHSSNDAQVVPLSKVTPTHPMVQKVTQFVQKYPRITVSLGLSALGCIGLMASNPKPDHYTAYAAEQVDEWLQTKCSTAKGNLQVAILNIPLRDLCQGAVQVGGKGVEFGIQTMTQPRKNYGLFSIYTTEIPTQGTFKTLGIGGQFITFQKGE